MHSRARLYTSGYRPVLGGGPHGRDVIAFIPVRLPRPPSLRDRLPHPALLLAGLAVVLAAVAL